MNYEIRDMQQNDATLVLEIFGEGIESGNASFDQNVPTWEVWDNKFLKICRYVLVNENDETVGWAALQKVSNRDCFWGVAEVSIYLKSQVQGKGLGTILLQKLILGSEEQGLWTLQSGIFQENKASISIHQKLGFRLVGRRERMGKMNGIWRDFVLLEKRSKVVGV